MPGIVYSHYQDDPTEVYHTDPSCHHAQRIIRNRNAISGKVSRRGVGFITPTKRKLRWCEDCV